MCDPFYKTCVLEPIDNPCGSLLLNDQRSIMGIIGTEYHAIRLGKVCIPCQAVLLKLFIVAGLIQEPLPHD